MSDEDIDTSTVKYLIHEKFVINGVAERSDIIGALFGQTEGLIGEGLDLRELQKTSRISRIVVKLQYNKKQRKTTGIIIIPSSLDRVETALLAATIETVDRIGPCVGKISLQKIEDVRENKRKQITSRASQILKGWDREVSPESVSLIDEVLKDARVSGIQPYGSEKLPAGPDVENNDNLIIVEGRADVLNLLKNGFRNVIAVQGTNIPNDVIELTKRKVTTAFLDGDRGAELILRELIHLTDIDYVARAPPKLEVEELSSKEILKALRTKLPFEQIMKELDIAVETNDKPIQKSSPPPFKPVPTPSKIPVKVEEVVETPVSKIPEEFTKLIDEIKEKTAILLDSANEIIDNNVPVKELTNRLTETDGIQTVIYDGIITQRLLDLALSKNITTIIGAIEGEITKKPVNVTVLTYA